MNVHLLEHRKRSYPAWKWQEELHRTVTFYQGDLDHLKDVLKDHLETKKQLERE